MSCGDCRRRRSRAAATAKFRSLSHGDARESSLLDASPLRRCRASFCAWRRLRRVFLSVLFYIFVCVRDILSCAHHAALKMLQAPQRNEVKAERRTRADKTQYVEREQPSKAAPVFFIPYFPSIFSTLLEQSHDAATRAEEQAARSFRMSLRPTLARSAAAASSGHSAGR